MNEFHCPKCNTKVEYPDNGDLYTVMVEHVAQCSGALIQKPKNITDVVPKEILNGNLISIEDVLGIQILVTGMSWKDSSFKEDSRYLQLDVELDGERKTLNTGAERIVQAFEYVKPEALPMFVTFEKLITKNNRRVYKIIGNEVKE